MRVLLALLLAAGSLSAQTAFNDPDYTFSFDLPPGLEILNDVGVAQIQGKNPDEVANIPRSSADGDIAHQFYFADTVGRGREGSLLLADGPPPFGDPEQFVQALEQEMGMKVDLKGEPLRPPTYAPGIRIEGVRTNPKGVEMRATVVYYIISSDPLRWGLLRLQAPAADWDAAGAEFLQAIASVEFPMPEGGGAAQGARPGGGARANPRAPGGARPSANESWNTLQVTGSLVLAAALLLSLFFAGRGSP